MGWVIVAFVVLAAIVAFGAMRTLTVMPGKVALLYRKGKFAGELPPGFHRWFDLTRSTKTFVFPTVRQTLAAHDVTVITRDQFSFRLALTPIYEIVDARTYHETRPSDAVLWPGFVGVNLPDLHAPLLAATIEKVASLTLEEFLEEPAAIAKAVRDRIGESVPGAAILDLLVTSITMPPEVRKMFTEVERARREGLAALERARGETASLRALANAARSLNNNPNLAQLRTLQTIESAKGPKTIVLGSIASANIVADASKPTE